MSVNASMLELNQLVYRHLKENGFCSAAEELQRHNPQEETDISVSLLDIYRSWLKDSKKKKQPNSTKRSKSEEKGKTSTKAKPTSPKKKTDKPAKTQSPSKKSTSLKRKKGEETKGSAVKAKKSKPSATDTAAGGDGSDSDSSLDVEKWKKLILQMTDVDVVKMESINALDSSLPQPKKKRVRKPRAKPPTKTDTPVQLSNDENVKDEEKAVTQTPEETLIKKRGSAAHVSSETPIKTPNLNKNQKQQPELSTMSPQKLAKSKDTMISVSVAEKKTDEPKKKKKEKKASEYNMEGDANNIEKGKQKYGNGRKTTDVTEHKAADTPAEENRDRAITETDMKNVETFSEDISESAPLEKKDKKKKKVKPRCEENVADLVEEKMAKKQKMVDMESSELNSAEEINISELGVKKKKAKKKKKESTAAEKSSEEAVQEKMAKKKKEKNPDEDISEQEKDKSNEKNMSTQTGEHHKPMMEILDHIKQEPQENIRKKKKKKQHNSVDLTPADQETASPTRKKKKKKNKFKSDEVPEEAVVSAEDATATSITSDDSHKKKKKKSKSSDS